MSNLHQVRPARRRTRSKAHSSGDAGRASSQEEAEQPLPELNERWCTCTNPTVANLIKTWREGPALWMSVFDDDDTFRREICDMLPAVISLRMAVCAATLRYISIKSGLASDEIVAQRYYGSALHHFRADLAVGPIAWGSLATAILLCTYEIIASKHTEHDQHFLGTANLVQHLGISARSTGLERSCFWIFVRHDLWNAILHKHKLSMPTDRWQMPNLAECRTDEDYTTYLMFLVATIVEYTQGAAGSVRSVHDALAEWHDMLPEHYMSYPQTEIHGCLTYFRSASSAIGTLWYSMALLLLQSQDDSVLDAEQQQNHVKRILLGSTWPLPSGALCFAVLPIYYAAMITDRLACTTYAETALLQIQSELGFATQTLIEDIKKRRDMHATLEGNNTSTGVSTLDKSQKTMAWLENVPIKQE